MYGMQEKEKCQHINPISFEVLSNSNVCDIRLIFCKTC